MLQQTQVTTVIPYYQRFMRRFPDIEALAKASEDSVLELWTGLGYYARARNLHKAAKMVLLDHDGKVPCDQVRLEALPGIGRSTAGAIRALGCGQHAVILDGNVKRVLSRHQAVDGWPGNSSVAARLWELASNYTPQSRVAHYTQAIMDLGSIICTRSQPACVDCPLASDCLGVKSGDPLRWPHRKPKTPRPHRSIQMLLLRNSAGELLLQKRPASGLWGGLWSLPETETGIDIIDWLPGNLGFEAVASQPWAPFDHQFTHFRLSVAPLLVDVVESSAGVQEIASDLMLWYNTAHPAPGGFPAPVVKLLQQYQTVMRSP